MAEWLTIRDGMALNMDNVVGVRAKMTDDHEFGVEVTLVTSTELVGYYGEAARRIALHVGINPQRAHLTAMLNRLAVLRRKCDRPDLDPEVAAAWEAEIGVLDAEIGAITEVITATEAIKSD